MHSGYIVVAFLVGFLVESEAVCSRTCNRGITAQDRTKIINEHNAVRLQIANGRVPNQPRSSNMKRMSWDNTLANQAQIIADTCNFRHVKVNDGRFYFVGQNLYWAASTVFNRTANWPAAVNSWFVEYKTYTFGNSVYNHYTQLVWADTHLVGCGYTCYEKEDGWYEKLYVCNYGPGGNIIGQNPYKVGTGCQNLC